MVRKLILMGCFFISGVVFLSVLVGEVWAQSEGGEARAQGGKASAAFRSTPYPLPRFVSLAKDEIYVRTGPGGRYPIKWIFKKKGLPVEIILEYGNWRKIRDHENATGWVFSGLISGKRTALVEGDDLVSLYRKPRADSRLAAYLEPLSLLNVLRCADLWCEVKASGYKGWVRRAHLWGVYEGENFD